jgi:hypothetical protein
VRKERSELVWEWEWGWGLNEAYLGDFFSEHCGGDGEPVHEGDQSRQHERGEDEGAHGHSPDS